MKKILGLKSVISDVHGAPVLDAKGNTLSLGEAIITLVGNAQYSSGRDSLRADRVALEILGAGDEVDVEDYDYGLLRTAASANRAYTNLVMARVWQALGEKAD